MIDIQKVIATTERNMEGTDMFVVGCTCSAGNEVELLIDSDSAVSIDACATLSRTVEEELDREEEDFSLTVASAGIGSELKCLRQYRKLTGASVEVLLANGTKICAVLDDVSETALTLSYEEKQLVEGKKRKQLVTVTRVYPFAEIKYTKEYIDFK
ncbi:MAG: ribosome assembly cofactor RimP [Alistipes sp.]